MFSVIYIFYFFLNNVISFIQILATINTPKVQAPFGVSLLFLVLITHGYNQNYMKYIYNLNTISIQYLLETFIYFAFIYNFLLSLKMYTFEVFYFHLFF